MNVATSKLRRLPAEWEEQDGVLLAWPHSESDWKPLLAEIERVSAAIIAVISRFLVRTELNTLLSLNNDRVFIL